MTYINYTVFQIKGASQVAQIKNLPAIQESRVRSLGWKDHLEKKMATHSSILAWKSHGQRSLACYSPWGCRMAKELGVTKPLNNNKD